MQEAGIQPYLLRLSPDFEGDPQFLDSEVLILNIPPRNRDGLPDYHQRQLVAVREQAVNAGISKVLFISSTAVYPNFNRVVTEEYADPESLSRGGIPLLKMEQLFTQTPDFKTTVLRFGGLYGPDRHPGRFLNGKSGLSGGSNPVNMIHLEDCLGVIEAILDQQVWGETFNACSPNHPSRKEFYEKAALEMGIDPPEFSGEPAGFKKVSSDKLLKMLSYTFRH